MGRNDDEELSEEEKARRGMALMGILNYIRNANKDDDNDNEFKAQALGVARTFKIQYDAFLQVGFTRDEAMELVTALVSSISVGGK